MKPKYAKGDRVRITSCDLPKMMLDQNVSRYENMTGEVVKATNVVAFSAGPWANLNGPTGQMTIFHYTVKLNDEIVIDGVLEDFLEIGK